MKKNMKVSLLMMSILLLTGCGKQPAEEQHTKEELCQMCIDAYMEDEKLDLSFNARYAYATAEETYQEIVRLALWAEEKEDQVYDIFSSSSYKYAESMEEIMNQTGMSWYDLEAPFRDEKNGYLTRLRKNRDDYLLQILTSSNEDVQSRGYDICNVLMGSGFDNIVSAETEREAKNYKQMFIISGKSEVTQEILHKLYPDEIHQGAMDCIYEPTTRDSVEKAAAFLIQTGEYEKYAQDIEKASRQAHEMWRCDYGDCQNEGGKEAEHYEGEFCSYHAVRLNNGGKLKKKTPLGYNGGSGGGLGLGRDSETTSDKNTSSKKEEPKKEEKKELPYDPYDVYDYWDPEDFYYDWEDDFDGYEDAEDYWYEAWEEIE